MKRAALLILAASLCLPSLCLADTPVLTPPSYHPDAASDEAGLWMTVDNAEHDIKTSPTLIRDPALNAYVDKLVCKLAGAYCSSIRVYITEVPAFNAYSMPNGAIVVWSGLLLRTDNEAQLAFVLGHEITHYLHRHSLEQLERTVNTAGAMLFVRLAAAGAGVGFLGSAIELGAAGALFAHTRDQERDADAGGFKAATENGYDPRESATIWRAMAAETAANSHRDRDIFFSTHPQPEERLATMDKQATALVGSRTDWQVGNEEYRAVMAPFMSRWVEDELARGEPEESIVLFTRLAARDPSDGLYQYALGEAYRRRNGKDDGARALAAFQGATACANAPAQAWRGIGLMAMKSGDKSTARAAFTQYRAKSPDADDKAMIDYYLTQL